MKGAEAVQAIALIYTFQNHRCKHPPAVEKHVELIREKSV